MVELVALLRRRRGVLLAGPSGVGKTSLAVAVAGELELAGHPVVRVVASRSTAGIPLGALAVLLAPAGPLDDGVARFRPRAGRDRHDGRRPATRAGGGRRPVA